jgi:hypothetical protein
VKAAGEMTENGLFYVTEGAIPVYNEWHKGEIIIERYGLLHPKYKLSHNGEEFAELKWKRARSGVYEATGIRLELHVGSMGKSIRAKDDFSKLSNLIIKSPLNPRKPKMIIQLADSDFFTVHQYCGKTPADGFSLHVTKRHYVSYIMRLEFSMKKSDRTIARIHVPPIMRWEAHHFHQLLALLLAYVAYTEDHGLHRSKKGRYLREPTSMGRRKVEYTRNIASGMSLK